MNFAERCGVGFISQSTTSF